MAAEPDCGDARQRAAATEDPDPLIVLRFRILRSDPSTDFLRSACRTRSRRRCGREIARGRSSRPPPGSRCAVDLKQIAVEADVNIVLTGTFLNAAIVSA